MLGPIAVFFILLGLLSIRRRREAIRHRLRRIIIVEAVYFGAVLVLIRLNFTVPVSLLSGLLAALLTDRMIPARSRHIPASVRRRKIAEHELRTGKKFNSRKYELDHGIPFARGGSHTADNLRVVEKKRNRSKGAKSPWWDLFG